MVRFVQLGKLVPSNAFPMAASELTFHDSIPMPLNAPAFKNIEPRQHTPLVSKRDTSPLKEAAPLNCEHGEKGGASERGNGVSGVTCVRHGGGGEGRKWGKPAPEKQIGKAETRVMLTIKARLVTELMSKLEISPLNEILLKSTLNRHHTNNTEYTCKYNESSTYTTWPPG